MKTLQINFLKFTLLSALFFASLSSFAKDSALAKADSLFKLKLYTQSFEIYKSIHTAGNYSPAMLLKMAYIQEGLGHVGQSMYYLHLYEHATNDSQALEKMQELAEKFNLSGYESSDSNRFYRWLNKNLLLVESILALLLFSITGLAIFLKKRNQRVAISLSVAFVLSLAIAYVNNFITLSSVITGEPRVYLMEGPSAGASVAGILGDGHQLQVIGKQDVWLKVKWNDKNVFVKESDVLRITL